MAHYFILIFWLVDIALNICLVRWVHILLDISCTRRQTIELIRTNIIPFVLVPLFYSVIGVYTVCKKYSMRDTKEKFLLRTLES